MSKNTGTPQCICNGLRYHNYTFTKPIIILFVVVKGLKMLFPFLKREQVELIISILTYHKRPLTRKLMVVIIGFYFSGQTGGLS